MESDNRKTPALCRERARTSKVIPIATTQYNRPPADAIAGQAGGADGERVDLWEVPFCSGVGQSHSERAKVNPRPYDSFKWADVLALMKAPQNVGKDQARWAIFSSLPSRNFAEQRERGQFHVAWVDLDDAPPPVDDVALHIANLVGADTLTYTSRSAKRSNQKSRTLIPLATPIDGHRYELLSECINDRLAAVGITPDRATERAAQLRYLPNRGEYYQTSVIEFLGDLDWEQEFAVELAAKEAEIAELYAAHQRHQEVAAQKREERQQRQHQTGERSPIDAFNAEYSPREMWESNGATWRSRRGRSPYSTSGAEGITLLRDGQHWYSHHQSDVEAGIGTADPEGGGCWGDAFDLFVHFQHDGDHDAAIKAAGAMFEVAPGVTLTQHNQRAYRQAQAQEDAIRDFGGQVAVPTDSQALCSDIALTLAPPPSLDALQLANNIHARVLHALRLAEGEEGAELLRPDARVIDAMMHGAFWSGSQSKVFLLNEAQTLNRYPEREAFRFLVRRYGPVIDRKAVNKRLAAMNLGASFDSPEYTARRAKLMNQVMEIPGVAILDHLKYQNQREGVEWRTDMFADTSHMALRDEKARVVLAHRPFAVETADLDDRVIADYREHFARFDEFLEFLVMSRFSADRKKSYIWLHASSDWGKGFLLSVLSNIGAAVGTSVKEVEAMLEGRPVGRTPEEFKRSLVLVIDEFKTVKSELKQLQSEISLAPKNQLTSTVEVFAKLLMSAESVASLVTENGVEDQFANRMSIFQEFGSIEKRPLFNEIGKGQYRRAVTAYAANELNRMIEEMQRLGRKEAEAKADYWLNGFISRYGLDTIFERFSDSLAGVADDFAQWIESDVAAPKPLIDVPSRERFLPHARKALGDYLEMVFDNSEVGAYRKRNIEILKHLSADRRGAVSHRVNGVVKKAVRLKPSAAPEDDFLN